MQESNLSSKIVPSLVEDWSSFIQKLETDLEKMITKYNKDKQRIRDLERVINKINEIASASKANYKNILNYRELFKYIDKDLESSFDALEFFEREDNFDNAAVKTIYNQIINSRSIIELTSEYHSLSIKIQFDQERIKRLTSLIRGQRVDYTLIKELVDKYKYSDDKKKNILFYPVVMLSIKQKDINNKKDNVINEQDNQKIYQERFNKLCQYYHNIKETFNLLLVKCYTIREKMSHIELNTYYPFINNPSEMNAYNFNDETKFKIYTLSLFKIKKDIEKLIDSISELSIDDNSEDELDLLGEMIDEFETLCNMLNNYQIGDEIDNSVDAKVFFALDAFNHLIVNEDIVEVKNRSSLKALFEKIENNNNRGIEGVKTNHMLGVEDAERILGKNISMLATSKMRLAYVVVDKNILIIEGTTNNSVRFDKLVRLAISRNIVAIKGQIEAIHNNDADYFELENNIIKQIMGEEIKQKAI